MKKKVDVSDLKRGMYVCELDRPWSKTSFFFQGFAITSEEDIKALRRHCRYVYIKAEPKQGSAAHVPAWGAPTRRRLVADAPAGRKPDFRILEKTPVHARPKHDYQHQTRLEDEVEAIREAHQQATTLIYTIMDDAHLGKRVDTATAKKLVACMAKSVLRNPDALICFTQLKKKDEYTALHSLRVSILALAFGHHLGLEEEELNLLGLGALLHDIGKMRVPSAILYKPGNLTKREFEIMQRHIPAGVHILERTQDIPSKAIEVAQLHHERYNGTGYMKQLKRDQISLFGLLGAIVDVYDALTSDRIYQDGISPLDALWKMYEWRVKDFHPALVEQFIQCIGIFPIGSVVILNTNEVGVVRTMNRAQRLKPEVVLVLKPDKTRYGALRAVDLARETSSSGKPYEIKKTLPAGQYGIQPVHYLPVMARA